MRLLLLAALAAAAPRQQKPPSAVPSFTKAASGVPDFDRLDRLRDAEERPVSQLNSTERERALAGSDVPRGDALWPELERAVLTAAAVERPARTESLKLEVAALMRDKPELGLAKALELAFARTHLLLPEDLAAVRQVLDGRAAEGRAEGAGEPVLARLFDGKRSYLSVGTREQLQKLASLEERDPSDWGPESGAEIPGVLDEPQQLARIDGVLYAAAANGLMKREKGDWTLDLPRKALALREHRGRWYAGTGMGLWVREDSKWMPAGLADHEVFQLTEKDGELFASTSKGFLQLENGRDWKAVFTTTWKVFDSVFWNGRWHHGTGHGLLSRGASGVEMTLGGVMSIVRLIPTSAGLLGLTDLGRAVRIRADGTWEALFEFEKPFVNDVVREAGLLWKLATNEGLAWVLAPTDALSAAVHEAVDLLIEQARAPSVNAPPLKDADGRELFAP